MLKQLKKIALISSLLFISNAQADSIEDGRYWLNFSFLGNLPAQDWSWTLDLRQRWREEGENFDQFIASGYIIKKLSPKFALGQIGRAHV